MSAIAEFVPWQAFRAFAGGKTCVAPPVRYPDAVRSGRLQEFYGEFIGGEMPSLTSAGVYY